MDVVANYLRDVVGNGDEASKIINRIVAPTLENNPHICVVSSGMNGVAGVLVPPMFEAVVHTTSGDYSIQNPIMHAQSMIEKLIEQSKKLGATSVALSDIIDSSSKDPEFIKQIAQAMLSSANKYGVAITNGECAILGDVINPSFGINASATMISLRPLSGIVKTAQIQEEGIRAVVVRPGKKIMHLNSDGVGTKMRCYLRRAQLDGDAHLANALNDSLAMKVDDSIKIGAEVLAVFDTIETCGKINLGEFQKRATQLGLKHGLEYVLLTEPIEERICGTLGDKKMYNVGGTAVCLVDPEKLKKGLVPNEGDYLIALRSQNPNPRSNGVSALRRIAKEVYGENWHQNKDARSLLEYMSSPSTIFYSLFRELIDGKNATAVYHMSGGAFNGKLARPLAKNGLYAEIEVFPPTLLQKEIMRISKTKPEEAYQTWPMNNEAFVAVPQEKVEQALDIIALHGMHAGIAGVVQKAHDKTGVTIRNVPSSTFDCIYFSGE